MPLTPLIIFSNFILYELRHTLNKFRTKFINIISIINKYWHYGEHMPNFFFIIIIFNKRGTFLL